MSNLPKFIEEAIRKSANYHAKAKEQQDIFEKWIEKNYGEDAINDDSIRDSIIDRIELSNDPETAIVLINDYLDDYTEVTKR